jgi:hypothetical protein
MRSNKRELSEHIVWHYCGLRSLSRTPRILSKEVDMVSADNRIKGREGDEGTNQLAPPTNQTARKILFRKRSRLEAVVDILLACRNRYVGLWLVKMIY